MSYINPRLVYQKKVMPKNAKYLGIEILCTSWQKSILGISKVNFT